MKNIERIRQMNSEELAEFIGEDCTCCVYDDRCVGYYFECKEGIKQWLEQEVEE